MALEKPYGTMFRQIKQSEQDLTEKAEDLQQAYSEVDQIFNAALPLRIVNKDFELI